MKNFIKHCSRLVTRQLTLFNIKQQEILNTENNIQKNEIHLFNQFYIASSFPFPLIFQKRILSVIITLKFLLLFFFPKTKLSLSITMKSVKDVQENLENKLNLNVTCLLLINIHVSNDRVT